MERDRIQEKIDLFDSLDAGAQQGQQLLEKSETNLIVSGQLALSLAVMRVFSQSMRRYSTEESDSWLWLERLRDDLENLYMGVDGRARQQFLGAIRPLPLPSVVPEEQKKRKKFLGIF